MFLFTVALTLIILGIVVFFLKFYSTWPGQPKQRITWTRHVGIGLVALGVVTLLATVITIVPARSVGVPVTYGVAGNPLPNGLNVKAPWTTVELMPTTPQSLDATMEDATIAKDKDNADVYVSNNVRWALVEEHATSVYYEARDFEAVSDLLVKPKLREAISTVMKTYDPLAEDKPSNAEVAQLVKAEMQRGVGERFSINSVSVTLIDFADATKDRINALNIERGNTRIAEQKVITAEAQAEANRVLADSVSNDPNVLVALCLDLIAEGKQLPAGMQCWPGQAEAASVIVGGAPANE